MRKKENGSRESNLENKKGMLDVQEDRRERDRDSRK